MAKKDKKLSRVKSIFLKLNLDEDNKSAFNEEYERQFKATQFLMNELISWSGQTYYKYNEDREFIKCDGESELRKIYDHTNKKYSFESFRGVMSMMYRAVMEASSKSVSPSLFGTRSEEFISEKEAISHIEKIEKENGSKKIKFNKEDSVQLERYLFHIGFYDRNNLLKGFHSNDQYSITANVKKQATSWVAKDKERSVIFAEEEAWISENLAKINQSDIPLIIKFRDFCVKNDIIKHFDDKVKSYLKDCLIPFLKEGVSPTRENSFYMDGDSKRRFSLNSELGEFLKKNKKMWEGKNPLIVEYSNILNKMFTHSKHKPRSAYPFIRDDQFYRYGYLLGKNYITYKFDYSGHPIGDIEVDVRNDFGKQTIYTCVEGVEFPNISLMHGNGRGNSKKLGGIPYLQKYHNGSLNPSPYFKNLKIWKAKGEDGIYIISFEKRGRVHHAVIKEPLVSKLNGKYYIKLSFTVVNPSPDDKTNENLKWLKSSALSPKETEKNAERVSSLTGQKIRYMGIDLGQSNPYAYAIGEEVIGGNYNIIASGIYEQNKSLSSKYFDFIGKLAFASKIIYKYKNCDTELNEEEVNYLSEVVEFCKNSNLGERKKKLMKQWVDIPKSFATQSKLAQGKIEVVKKSFGSIPSIFYYYISAKFKAIRNERKYALKHNPSSSDKMSGDFYWIDCCDRMKSFARKISYLGTDNDREMIETKELIKLRDGVKKNYLKQIAADVVKTALKHDCKILVMEELNQFPKSKTRRDNYNLHLWSPKIVQDAIKNAASWHGIEIVEVSERGTSQIHYESKTIGYRDGRKLYAKNGEEIISVDADENAAKNIVERAITRHANTSMIYLKSGKTDGEDNQMGKRDMGFLNYKFGNLKVAKKFFKENYKNEKLLWISNGEWVTSEEKKKIVNSIKELKKEGEATTIKVAGTPKKLVAA